MIVCCWFNVAFYCVSMVYTSILVVVVSLPLELCSIYNIKTKGKLLGTGADKM